MPSMAKSSAGNRKAFSVYEVAAQLGVSVFTVRREVSEGRLPHVRVRGRIVVLPESLERYLSTRERAER
jgi:excisionase family DNA binding protein